MTAEHWPPDDSPRCGTCPFWECFPELEDYHPTFNDDLLGECHRGHPVAVQTMKWAGGDQARTERLIKNHEGSLALWPQTGERDWCGEHPDFPAFVAARRRAPES